MPKPQLKILSIDGGGIRGVIPCRILAFFEAQIGYSLSNTFDLIAGTSTGGIISLGLSCANPATSMPFTASDMLDLYKENGLTIFRQRQKTFWSRLAALTPISSLVQKPYQSEDIEGVLLKYFGEIRLAECQTEVLVTTHDIKSNRPFYFSSRLAKKKTEENFLLRAVARATSAAPTYFEPIIADYKENEDVAFIDGGVFANNPATLAYCEAKEIWKHKTDKAFEPDVLPDDQDLPFFMLSLSTGHTPKSISGKDAQNWGTLDWVSPLINDIFMQSVSESTHYMMQHLLPPYTDGTTRYHRIELQIPKEYSEMDNASGENIKKLIEIADKYIEANEKDLLKVCEMIK
jgi:patatin-like phospholipase/acyl hydrolase